MGLQKFEGRLERLVDGTFSKAFRGELHPVEIGRRLTREMDLQRRLGVHGLIAPNAFGVRLATDDFERFESFLEALIRELEEAAREHARSENYVVRGPGHRDGLRGPSPAPGPVHRGLRFQRGPIRADRRIAGPGRGGTHPHRSRDRSPSGASRRAPWSSRTRTPAVATPRSGALGNDVVLVDLNSTNGTRVNGTPIRERKLMDGDEIRIGTTSVRFEAS